MPRNTGDAPDEACRMLFSHVRTATQSVRQSPELGGVGAQNRQSVEDENSSALFFLTLPVDHVLGALIVAMMRRAATFLR